jgi:signal transduction histidine kinase
MTQLFGNMTIRRKLISIIMITCTTSLILVGVSYILWQWFYLRQQLVTKLSTQAKVIADNCKASVSFDSPDDANDALKSLMADSTIIFGGIYTPNGKIFSCYHNENYNYNDHDRESITFNNNISGYHYFGHNKLTLFEPVIVEGNVIGIVCLESTLSDLYNTLKTNIIFKICAMLLVSIFIYFMSFRLQGIISNPILDLADIANKISQQKEYSIRVNRQSNDEIGILVRAFNDMLEQIQQRDAALVNTNELLEEKVQERTAELRNEIVVKKKAQVELAHTVRKLLISNNELREFTRIAAHDLQTPLRAIGILSDWISDDYVQKADEEGQKHARLLCDRSKRIGKLLTAITHYSELSLINKHQERCDLNTIVSRVIENIKKPDNVRIIIENKLPVVIGIQRFTEELFENLFKNAIQCMDKPQGIITIGCVEDGDFWQFSVADNGTGIEEKYFKKIFEIFQMLSLRDQTENVGIGLSIVKKVVEMYGGRVWVISQIGKGSTFFFTLPKADSKVAQFPTYADSTVK